MLSVAAEVIDLPSVVVTDQNAASDYARYVAGAARLSIVNRGLIFAEYWTDPDPVEQ